jgi:hypothetical protein
MFRILRTFYSTLVVGFIIYTIVYICDIPLYTESEVLRLTIVVESLSDGTGI